MTREELIEKFPYLGHLHDHSTHIVNTLFVKEQGYEGSWKKRGGVGAFMMMARKWDRIESIVGRHGYDVFDAQKTNTAGIGDDLDDLIGYLLLIRAYLRHQLASGDYGPRCAAEQKSPFIQKGDKKGAGV